MTDRCLLLAGSYGPERVPPRPDPDDADWFLPLHLRDEHMARERIATQVADGADVVVAPTWLTHRRALLPLGETRRAAAWTAAAVALARQGLELGLERREERLAEAADDDPCRERPAPLVAASLPALDDEPEAASGRLLPREAATTRDYRDQAGLIADAEPDLILVEGQRTEGDARVAVTEAVETGLATWAALTPPALATGGTERWLEWAGSAGLTQLLLPPPLAERLPAAGGPLSWGGVGFEPETVSDWLDAGAGAVALLDRATAANLGRLRDAIDDYERVGFEAERASRDRWADLVARGAAMAPGGAAAWVGEAATTALPAGFGWQTISPREADRLPHGHFRLVVTQATLGLLTLARTLERGGILVGPATAGTGLRALVVDEAAQPAIAIYRREDEG